MMRLSLAFIGLNIVLCSLFLGDAFLFPGKAKTVSITNLDSKLTSYKNRSYYNYFLYTSDNCRYEIPESLQGNLNVTDTVTIFSSPVLRMPTALNYRQNGEEFHDRIGQLNKNGSLRSG